MLEYGRHQIISSKTLTAEAQRQDASGQVAEGAVWIRCPRRTARGTQRWLQKEIGHAPGCHQKPESGWDVAFLGVDDLPIRHRADNRPARVTAPTKRRGGAKKGEGFTFNRCQKLVVKTCVLYKLWPGCFRKPEGSNGLRWILPARVTLHRRSEMHVGSVL